MAKAKKKSRKPAKRAPTFKSVVLDQLADISMSIQSIEIDWAKSMNVHDHNVRLATDNRRLLGEVERLREELRRMKAYSPPPPALSPPPRVAAITSPASVNTAIDYVIA